MSFKSIRLVENHHNRRSRLNANRALLITRLGPIQQIRSLTVPCQIYSTLVPDPLASPSSVDVKFLVLPGNRDVMTSSEHSFLVALIDRNDSKSGSSSSDDDTLHKVRATSWGWINSSKIDYSLPPDSYVVNMNMERLGRLIRDVLLNTHLDRTKFAEAVFVEANLNSAHASSLADDFFSLDSYSKCLVLILYTSLWLATESSGGSQVRLCLIDLFPEYYINVERKSYSSLVAENYKYNPKRIAPGAVDVLLSQFVDPVIYSGQVRTWPLNYPSENSKALFSRITPQSSSTPDGLFSRTLNSIISAGIDASFIPAIPEEEDQDSTSQTISLRMEDGTDALVNVRTIRNAHYKNCILAFPLDKTFASYGHYTLTTEAKIALLLPGFLYEGQTSCGLVGSTLQRNDSLFRTATTGTSSHIPTTTTNRWTFAMADFTPCSPVTDLPGYVKRTSTST